MNRELSGHEIWEMALRALSPLDLDADLTKEDVIFSAIGLDHRDMINEDEPEFTPVYLDTLVGDICAKKDELDKVVERHLGNDWHTDRISKMDLVILRTAIFGMTYVTDISVTVTSNEAIELAKIFSNGCSRKFVSDILSNVLKELEART